MKRIALLLGCLLGVGGATAAAQTHVSLSVGFGVPRPYVSELVVVERPHFYRTPVLVVVRRPYRVRPLFVDRVVVREGIHRRHHHRYHYDYDDDDE